MRSSLLAADAAEEVDTAHWQSCGLSTTRRAAFPPSVAYLLPFHLKFFRKIRDKL
jgi:hypothetical protein